MTAPNPYTRASSRADILAVLPSEWTSLRVVARRAGRDARTVRDVVLDLEAEGRVLVARRSTGWLIGPTDAPPLPAERSAEDRVADALRATGWVTVLELARAAHVHEVTCRAHVRELIACGLARRGARGRVSWVSEEDRELAPDPVREAGEALRALIPDVAAFARAKGFSERNVRRVLAGEVANLDTLHRVATAAGCRLSISVVLTEGTREGRAAPPRGRAPSGGDGARITPRSTT